MGYRSDVRITTSKNGFEKLTEFVASYLKEKQRDNEHFNLLENLDIKVEGKEQCYFGWNYIKWYEYDYEDVDAIREGLEYLGVMLLEQQLKDSLLQELKDNPNNEYKKKHDIIQSIKDLDAQMVTIILKHNEEIISFKYPKRILENLEFYESHIPDLEIRNKVEQLFKDIRRVEQDNMFIKEIAKIEYKKKVYYEDKELLNLKENVSKDSIETHDIVDDMFE